VAKKIFLSLLKAPTGKCGFERIPDSAVKRSAATRGAFV